MGGGWPHLTANRSESRRADNQVVAEADFSQAGQFLTGIAVPDGRCGLHSMNSRGTRVMLPQHLIIHLVTQQLILAANSQSAMSKTRRDLRRFQNGG